MESNIADFLKSVFSETDFDRSHFGESASGENVPQMHNIRNDYETSRSEEDLDEACANKTQETACKTDKQKNPRDDGGLDSHDDLETLWEKQQMLLLQMVDEPEGDKIESREEHRVQTAQDDNIMHEDRMEEIRREEYERKESLEDPSDSSQSDNESNSEEPKVGDNNQNNDMEPTGMDHMSRKHADGSFYSHDAYRSSLVPLENIVSSSGSHQTQCEHDSVSLNEKEKSIATDGELEEVEVDVKDGLDFCKFQGLTDSPLVHETSPENRRLRDLMDQRNFDGLEVSDIEVIMSSLLTEPLWSLVGEDNLKLDDWTGHGEDEVCDEEDDSLEEETEEQTERDWKMEQARIEAFNRYYESGEEEETTQRSHKVTFCLDQRLSQSDEDEEDADDGSGDELCSDSRVSELHLPEFCSPDQSCEKNYHHPSEVSEIPENISTCLSEEHWTSSQMETDNMELEGNDLNNKDIRTKTIHQLEEKSRNVSVEWRKNIESEQKRITSQDQESSSEDIESSSGLESNSDASSILMTKDESDSDELQRSQFHARLQKFTPKRFQKGEKTMKERPGSNKCVVAVRSALALVLVTGVGVLSYWWATDSLDWIYGLYCSIVS